MRVREEKSATKGGDAKVLGEKRVCCGSRWAGWFEKEKVCPGAGRAHVFFEENVGWYSDMVWHSDVGCVRRYYGIRIDKNETPKQVRRKRW